MAGAHLVWSRPDRSGPDDSSSRLKWSGAQKNCRHWAPAISKKAKQEQKTQIEQKNAISLQLLVLRTCFFNQTGLAPAFRAPG